MNRKKSLADHAGGGDDGNTGLLGGGRVAKDDDRIEVYGTVDEASSAIGLAKALTAAPEVVTICEQLQRGLYRLGAELATAPGREGTWGATSAADVAELVTLIAGLEARSPMPREFILPGATPASGALDLARTVVRRAEREWVRFQRGQGSGNPEVGRYLNRLSLLLFVLGRFEEHQVGSPAQPASRIGHEAELP